MGLYFHTPDDTPLIFPHKVGQNPKTLKIKQPDWLSGYKAKSIVATIISEPGSTGTDWRLHYSLDIFNLSCDHFTVTRSEVEESFINYDVNPNDVFIGDRMYGTMKGLWHVRK